VGEEVLFVQGSRRPDQLPREQARPALRADPEKRDGKGPAEKGKKNGPPPQVKGLPLFPSSKTEPDGPDGTQIVAIEANEALGGDRFPGITPDGRPLAGLLTPSAVRAAFNDGPLQNGFSGEKAQESAQRAEIFAPETPFQQIQSHDEAEKQPRKDGLVKMRFPEGEKESLKQGVKSLGRGGQERNRCLGGGPEDRFQTVLKEGIEEKGERPDEQAEGIEESRDLGGEKGGGQKKEQNEILPPPGARGEDRSFSPVEKPREVVNRSQGADPPAEDPAQKDREDDEEKRQEKPGNENSRGKEGGQEDQGVEVEKKADGIAQGILPFRLRLEEKEEKQEQKSPLDEPAK